LQIRRLALLALVLSSTAQAANFNVTTTADSGAGSLRQALIDSNSPAGGVHTISFAGAFPDNGVILLDANLPTIQSQSLIVTGGSRNPRIDGQSLHTLFDVGASTGTFELSDMVLQNGAAPEKGGCVTSGNGASVGSMLAERVVFSGCQATGASLIRGGAIFWNRTSGSLSLIDSQFLDNSVLATANNGESGGGAVFTTANLTSTRTLFQGNTALASNGGGVGGAVALVGSARSSSIMDSTFLFNGASPASALFGYGGAVYVGCDNCTAQVVRSYLRGNSANYGGAVYARKTSAGAADVFVTLANSTFHNSSVVNEGGAVSMNSGTSLSASNNTFYNGDASAGAHLRFGGAAEVNYFRANLLAPTYAGSACAGSPVVTNAGFVNFNVFADSSCTALAAGSLPNSPLGSVFVDERPGLVGVLRFNGSAVIDSITNPGICEPRDARFVVRPIDGNGDGNADCDVGAYEDPFDIIFMGDFDG
jgi:hypothetical protein